MPLLWFMVSLRSSQQHTTERPRAVSVSHSIAQWLQQQLFYCFLVLWVSSLDWGQPVVFLQALPDCTCVDTVTRLCNSYSLIPWLLVDSYSTCNQFSQQVHTEHFIWTQKQNGPCPNMGVLRKLLLTLYLLASH